MKKLRKEPDWIKNIFVLHRNSEREGQHSVVQHVRSLPISGEIPASVHWRHGGEVSGWPHVGGVEPRGHFPVWRRLRWQFLMISVLKWIAWWNLKRILLTSTFNLKVTLWFWGIGAKVNLRVGWCVVWVKWRASSWITILEHRANSSKQTVVALQNPRTKTYN